jgi:hypothetical protein
MPKGIITAMENGYKGKGLSKQEVNKRVYGGLNNMGAMHGNKDTAKGVAMEKKFEADHGKGSKKK